MSVVDTNVLVHASAPASQENERAQTAIINLNSSDTVWISRQIIREYLAVMTRPPPRGHGLKVLDALAASQALLRSFEVFEDGPSVWSQFERLARSFDFSGKQVHDANIVATMLAYGETRLLTYNVKDFRRFEPLIEIIEP